MSHRTMARVCATLLLAMLLALLPGAPTAAQSDWKLRRFNATADQCYQAAERAITKHHGVTFKDAKLRVVRYEIGVTALSWGYRMAVSIAPSMDNTGCVATHAVEVKGGPLLSWGRGKKEVQQVYAWMEEELSAMFRATGNGTGRLRPDAGWRKGPPRDGRSCPVALYAPRLSTPHDGSPS